MSFIKILKYTAALASVLVAGAVYSGSATNPVYSGSGGSVGPSGATMVTQKDGATQVGSTAIMDFTGNVTVTPSGNTATVDITGGGGGATTETSGVVHPTPVTPSTFIEDFAVGGVSNVPGTEFFFDTSTGMLHLNRAGAGIIVEPAAALGSGLFLGEASQGGTDGLTIAVDNTDWPSGLTCTVDSSGVWTGTGCVSFGSAGAVGQSLILSEAGGSETFTLETGSGDMLADQTCTLGEFGEVGPTCSLFNAFRDRTLTGLPSSSTKSVGEIWLEVNETVTISASGVQLPSNTTMTNQAKDTGNWSNYLTFDRIVNWHGVPTGTPQYDQCVTGLTQGNNVSNWWDANTSSALNSNVPPICTSEAALYVEPAYPVHAAFTTTFTGNAFDPTTLVWNTNPVTTDNRTGSYPTAVKITDDDANRTGSGGLSQVEIFDISPGLTGTTYEITASIVDFAGAGRCGIALYGGTSGLTLYLMVSTWAGNNLQTPSGGLLTPLNAPSTATTNITVTGAVSDALALWRTRPQTQIIDTCFWGLSDVTLLPQCWRPRCKHW